MDSKVISGVKIKELTVKDIYEWLADHLALEKATKDKQEIDPATIVDNFLLEGIALADLRRMTSLTSKQMETVTPATLQNLAKECKQLNHHFFQLRAMVTTGVRPTPEPSLTSSDTPSPK